MSNKMSEDQIRIAALVMENIAEKIQDLIPPDYGFAVMVFPFHTTGFGNYISNAQREDMIKVLRDTADNLEQNPHLSIKPFKN